MHRRTLGRDQVGLMSRFVRQRSVVIMLAMLGGCGALSQDELTAVSERYCAYRFACDDPVTWCEIQICYPYETVSECTAGVRDWAMMWDGELTPYCRDAYIKRLE